MEPDSLLRSDRPRPPARIPGWCLSGVAVIVAGLALVGGCHPDELPGPSGVLQAGPVVLEPVASNAITQPAAARISAARAAVSTGAQVAYVSLPPGTIPDGELAVIRNTRTAAEVLGAMASGGLDPVAIEAAAGDSLALDVELVGGSHQQLGLKVPLHIAPRVVRTHPGHGKRDLALNTGVLVVFSEPVDPTTVRGVRLLHGFAQVSGKAQLSPDGLRVTFQPDQLLAPNTQYIVAVSAAVRDLSGEALDQPVAEEFTTGTTVVSAWIATQQAAIIRRWDNGKLRTFEMSATRDAAGRVTGTFDIFYPEDGGGLISGTVSCFTIVNDTTAWVGGTMRSSWDPADIGGELGWRVVDRGPLAAGVPDQLSGGFPLAADTITAQQFCATTPTQSKTFGPILLVDLLSGDLVISSGPGVTPPPPPPPPGAGVSQIAFAAVSSRGFLSEGINVMSTDRSFVRSLTTTPSDFRPAWAPDGLHIAFESERGHPGDGDIYVMSYDGSGVRQLTSDASDDREPAWSPDGRSIAFYRNGMITVMSAVDGSGVTPLTSGAHPSWSPDSRRLALAGPNGHIWLVNVDGSGLIELTSGNVFDDTPAWSPDGRRLAFQRTAAGSTTGAIYLINADGSGVTQLTLGGQTPSWSPDGTMLVFENYGMNLINVDGSGLTRLTGGYTPEWSAVGQMPPRPPATRTLTVAGGNGQTDTVQATLPVPLSVRVQDAQGNAVPTVPVNFIVEAGQGASIPTNWTTTDSSGIASVTLTLGGQPGVATVRAFGTDGTISTAGVVFTETATGGAPVSITGPGSTGGSIALVNSTIAYSVAALDSRGYPVPGVPINWTVSANGGTIAPAQVNTGPDSSGAISAKAVETLGPDDGVVQATATAPTIAGAPSVTFTTQVVTAMVTVGGGTTGSCVGSYSPGNVILLVGKTMGWVWKPCWLRPPSLNPRLSVGGVAQRHDVTFEDDPTQPTSSPTMSTGWLVRTFTTPGVYRYRCTLHSTDFTTGEVGTVTVQ